MPMIDVYAAEGLFPPGCERKLGEALTHALLRAEGVATPGPTHLNNTGFYLHVMPPERVQTAGSANARTVRVQVITPPAVLTRDGQRQLVKDATAIVAETAGDPEQAARTWVLLSEGAEGGWGIAGTAFGKEEFAALATAAAARSRG
ncbi:MAG TPA: tautomerase family protein [Candidatus Elarobacter sp.]|jgi:phenylpyruvate tautomerase PptA (4-oxalocrotonate tautomerase family)|nr:tautomerase family protein [Candidatus Elarobacter sp.]